MTNTSRRLTDTGGWAASGDYTDQSIISADGRQVVYHWFIEQGGSNELRLIGLDANEASRPQVLLRVDPGEYVVPAALTPDGSQVVVVKTLADKTVQLGLVATSSGLYKSIKSLDWRYPRGVSLSPDGRYLAYDVPAGDAGSPRDILMLALDGSRETVTVSGPADDLRPLWTADGSRLVFMSNRSGNPALWSVAIEAGRAAGAPVMVKANTGAVIPVGISRAGALYYWVSGGSRRNIYTAPIVDLKVGSPSLLTEQFVDESSGPAWSPDGRSLAFFSFRGRPTLVIRAISTGTERTVVVPQGLQAPFFSGPRWFPDGRSVLVLAAEPQGSGRAFYRVNVETGAAERLNHTDRRIGSFALSPDGRSIFWSVQSVDDNLPRGELTRYDIADNRETVLKRGEWFIAVAVSPDGKQLAYLKSIRTDEERRKKEYPSVVEVMPTGGGAARQTFRDAIWLTGHRYNTLNWTPDGRFLMFVRDDGRLWRVPASGGEPQEMDVSMKARIKAPSIHPDGTRIVFGTAEADSNEYWALENFLPPRSPKS
jgi:Tol biopolymer transport system component